MNTLRDKKWLTMKQGDEMRLTENGVEIQNLTEELPEARAKEALYLLPRAPFFDEICTPLASHI